MDIPDAALKRTHAGAQAMAKFFVEQVDQALVTVDAKTLQAISATDCVACNNAKRKVAEYKDQKIHQLSSSFEVQGFAAAPESTDPKDRIVDVLTVVRPVEVVDANGKTVRTGTGANRTYRVVLVWAGTFWQISAAGLASA